jgi:hypothetical protein
MGNMVSVEGIASIFRVEYTVLLQQVEAAASDMSETQIYV